MTRRTFFSTLALFAMVMTMIVAGPADTSAQQNPNCCTYTVDAQGVAAPCNNFRLATRWDCNGTGVSFIKSYSGPVIVVEPIGPPLLAPCPPACKLTAISLDNTNFIGPNQTKQYIIGGCCYKVSFGYDAAGCIYIKISNC